ncbi:MAG: B12-binding domain-containing radical SAM protein [Coriobacteriia bacterium]|nr:B12-binding domain-containing radical SAM protein [Coriobacteriia bacterium]
MKIRLVVLEYPLEERIADPSERTIVSPRAIRRIALVTPPYHSGVVETAGSWPNAAFVYLAGSLRAAGYEPVIYDAMTADHDAEAIARELERIRPDMVVTTAYTSSYPKAVELLRLAKHTVPGVVTGIGGVHAHFMYEEVLSRDGDAVDIVFRGEGERTLPETVACLNAGDRLDKVPGLAFRDESGSVVATATRPFIADLDSLPTAWDLVDWSLYRFYPMPDTKLAIISTSRGCDQACTFCSQQAFWCRTWRSRSAENVVQEMEMLRDRFGVGVVMFSDETPTLDPVRWRRLLDLLIERDVGLHLLMETRVDDILRDRELMPLYHQAGVRHIYVGVERTDQATLDLFKKNTEVSMGKEAIDLINSHDMISETSLVLGLPDDTHETIETTFQLAQHYDPDLAFFLTIAPWPYADMYKDLEPYIVSHDYEDYNLVAPVVKPKAMTTDELMKEIIGCYRRFYMGKLKRIPTMSPFKREYFLVTMKLLMENSYLRQYMGGLGEMPAEVAALFSARKP